MKTSFHRAAASAAATHTAFRSAAGASEIALNVFGKRADGALAPLIVYFHGGLFNSGTLEDAQSIAQVLADSAVVVCVDYPLAPKTQFPATVEIAFEALQWACAHAAELGADAARVLVAGDQAGGNLAAALAMMARDRGLSATGSGKLKGQILITPMLDPIQSTLSMRAAADCPCRQAWADYLPAASDAIHPYAAPLHSRRLAGLAPTLIVTAERDPLRDEAEQYAAKLIAAGVPVQVRRLEAAGSGLLDQRCPHFSVVADAIVRFIADTL